MIWSSCIRQIPAVVLLSGCSGGGDQGDGDDDLPDADATFEPAGCGAIDCADDCGEFAQECFAPLGLGCEFDDPARAEDRYCLNNDCINPTAGCGRSRLLALRFPRLTGW